VSTPSVFRLSPLDGFELAQPVDPGAYERLYSLLARGVRASDWQPLEVELVVSELGRPLLPSDAPYLAPGALVLRSSAAGKLRRILSAHAELLPLKCADADLVLVNVTTALDALDEDAADIARFRDGRIMEILRHEFRPSVIGQPLFKIAGLRASDIYVDASVVAAASEIGLRGIWFEPVWKAPVNSEP
jgi:hypothetical protein